MVLQVLGKIQRCASLWDEDIVYSYWKQYVGVATDAISNKGEMKMAITHSYTTEGFFVEIYKRNKNSNDIEFLTKEINGSKTRVKCKCKKCGYEWETSANKLMNCNSGCGICHHSIKYTNDMFVEYINNNRPDITPLEEYINDRTKILCKCNNCNKEWMISPTHIKGGEGCPDCARIHLSNLFRKDYDVFVSQMNDIDKTIEIISKEYKNTKEKVVCKCLTCNNIWSSLPLNLLRGKGCPECKMSTGERTIIKYLNDNNIDYISQYSFKDCKNIKPLRFDFYIPSKDLLIEFDGEQHFKPIKFGSSNKSDKDIFESFEYIQTNDSIKDNYCKNNNKKLLRIAYYDYHNIINILDDNLLQ